MNRRMIQLTHPQLAAMSAALLITSLVGASDGVHEINQACAASGCFAGDSPGLPVEITQPGSYLLTSGIMVPDESTSGIIATPSLSSEDLVTIDLNGFGIVGPVTCSGSPVDSCTPSAGSGRGVDVQAGTVVVRNGSVSGMGFYGIIGAAVVEQVVASHNRRTGISATRITGCRAEQNGGDGFRLMEDGQVESSLAKNNRDNGFEGNGAFLNNSARGNGVDGFSVNGVLLGNQAIQNGGDGFALFAGTLNNNYALANALNGFVLSGAGMNNRAVGNGGDGFRAIDHTSLNGCLASTNGGPGLAAVGGVTGYSNCVFVSNNSGGAQVSGGIQTGQNICGTALCP